MTVTECALTEPSLRQRVKRETAAVHQHLEAQLGLLDPSLDVNRYLRVLETLPLCRDRPQLSCVEDRARCLYVLEGACLGGQVVSSLLRRRLGLAKTSGAAFFAGDGEGTLPRWTVVVAWLDGLPRAGASTTKIISAATATLYAFARWAAVARGGSPWSI